MTQINAQAEETKNQRTKVLWFSRHETTEDQMTDLERIFGPLLAHQVSTTANSVQDFVLPPNNVWNLLIHGKTKSPLCGLYRTGFPLGTL